MVFAGGSRGLMTLGGAGVTTRQSLRQIALTEAVIL
jgi:hypothetical protein